MPFKTDLLEMVLAALLLHVPEKARELHTHSRSQ